MVERFAGCVACAFAVGLTLLPGCAAPPAHKAAAPGLMDISQAPALPSALIVPETGPSTVPPSPGELAYRSMREGTAGMAPGAVAAGPAAPLTARQAATAAPAGASSGLPKLAIPSLQARPDRLRLLEQGTWKKPSLLLPSLAGR